MTSTSRTALLLYGTVLSLTGCYRTDPLYCETDRDCLDAPEGRRFCDVHGEFPASEGIGPTCIAAPGGVTVTAPAGPLDLVVGTSITVQVSVKRGPGIRGDVTVDVDGAPAGFAVDSLVIADGDEIGELVVRASMETPFGHATLAVGAHAGEVAATPAPLLVDVVGAPGTPDLSFGDQSIVQLEGLGFRVPPVAVFAQGDKVVVIGLIAMRRLLSSGDVDITFGQNGIVEYNLSPVETAQAAVSEDGDMVIAIQRRAADRSVIMVGRFAVDGGQLVPFTPLPTSLDGQYLGSIALAADGDVVVHGYEAGPAIWRLTGRLTIDESFGDEGKAKFPSGGASSGMQNAVHVQRNGAVVFREADRLRRLKSDGTADGSFGDNGYVDLPVSRGTPQWHQILDTPEGMLVLADDYLWRLSANGDIDPRFGSGGAAAFSSAPGTYFRARMVSRGPDATLWIVGESGNVGNGYTFATLVKIFSDGVLDPAYGDAGYTTDRSRQWFAEKAVFGPRHRATVVGLETERQGTMVRRYWY